MKLKLSFRLLIFAACFAFTGGLRAVDPVPDTAVKLRLDTGAIRLPSGYSISLADPAFIGTLDASHLPANAQGLHPKSIQSAAYTASANDYVPVDASAGNVTVTLPTAPADGTVIGAKLIAVSGSYTLTLAAGGTDVFNKAGASASITLRLLNQSAVAQYKASSGIWYVKEGDTPLSGLDARYDASGAATTASATKLAIANNLSDLASAATARTNLGLGTAATHATTDYATAAQGTLAGTAVQPSTAPILTGTNFTGIPESAVTNLTTDLAAKASAPVVQTYSGTGANVTVNATTTIFLLQATLTGSPVFTLPAASGRANGSSLTIIDPGGYSSAIYPVYVSRAGSDTVNGSVAPVIVLYGRNSRTLWSDGSGAWSMSAPLAERTYLGAAASGANSDITSLSGATSVTSTAGLTLAAGGTNQGITFTPTGTGKGLWNSAGLLNFGGASSSYAGFKNSTFSGGRVAVRLADDSGYASIDSNGIEFFSMSGTTRTGYIIDTGVGPVASLTTLNISSSSTLGSAGVAFSRIRHGVATLSSGTVTVTDANVTANTRIFLTAQDNNTVGALRVSARTAGTSFVISSSASDSGVIAYEEIEP